MPGAWGTDCADALDRNRKGDQCDASKRHFARRRRRGAIVSQTISRVAPARILLAHQATGVADRLHGGDHDRVPRAALRGTAGRSLPPDPTLSDRDADEEGYRQPA